MEFLDKDIFIFDDDPIDDEEFITIPDTGIHDFTRPILYTALDEPAEIINLDAGNLRVDTSANIVGNLTSGSRAIPKNFTGISAYSSGSERSVNSDSLGGIDNYTNVGSFTTSVYNANLHVGFGTYGKFGNAVATNGNGSLIIVGNKKSIVDGYFVGIGTTVGITTYYGSAFLYERISNNFVKRDCIVGQYSKPGTGSTHGIGVTGTNNDDYGYSVTMSIDGKTFAVGGPNIIWESNKPTTTGIASTTKSGVVWVYDYKPPVDPEFCGVGTLPVCCGIGTSTICDILESNSIGLQNSVLCGIGTTNICRTENVEVLSVLQGEGDGDLFGSAISISADGKTLVVGAPGLSCTSLGYNGGGAYVYDRNDTTYDKVGILTGLTASGTFGNSVSVSGDGYIIVVGDASQSKSYVYERDDKIYGTFKRIGTLNSGGTQVCISDDGETVITANASSSVVYDRSGSTFTSVGSLTGGSVGISCSPDGKIISTASANGYYVYNREGDVFYLNYSASTTLDSFDMSSNTKVIYRGNSEEIVSAAVTGRVYCDDQILETFVYTDQNGNVGVGTTKPLSRLHVNGSTVISNNLYVNGITTSSYFVGDGSGLYNINYSSTGGVLVAGIDTSGTSSFTDVNISRSLSVTQQSNFNTGNFSGIVTAPVYVSSGTTAVYSGINTSVINSNTTSCHYMTFDTNNSGIDISNFGSGKKVEIVARNSSVGSASLFIRTSTASTTGFTTVPRIVHSGGNITNGTISIAGGAGLLITIFNMNGTVIGVY